MDKEAVITQLRSALEEFLRARGLELVDIIYRQEGRDLFLRLLIDRLEGGITVGDCADLNVEIGALLDERDIIPEKYILEVSSPGLDRPLAAKNDFLRCKGEMIRLFLNEAHEGKVEMEGLIKTAEGENLLLDVKGKEIIVPLSKIRKGKQIF